MPIPPNPKAYHHVFSNQGVRFYRSSLCIVAVTERTRTHDHRGCGTHVHPCRHRCGHWRTVAQCGVRRDHEHRFVAERHWRWTFDLDRHRWTDWRLIHRSALCTSGGLVRSTRRGRPRRTGQSERGLATTELAFLTPLILFLIIGIAQAALWAHATAVAQAAADFGADIGSTYGADPLAGEEAARQFVAQSGGLNNVVPGSSLSTVAGVDQVTVTIVGEVPSVVGSLTVRAASTSAVEVIRP